MAGLDVAFIVALIGIAGTFAKIITDYTKVKTSAETMAAQIKDMKEDIKELYESRNETNKNIVKLTTILENLVNQNTTIEQKIDDLREKVGK